MKNNNTKPGRPEFITTNLGIILLFAVAISLIIVVDKIGGRAATEDRQKVFDHKIHLFLNGGIECPVLMKDVTDAFGVSYQTAIITGTISLQGGWDFDGKHFIKDNIKIDPHFCTDVKAAADDKTEKGSNEL